MKPMKKGPGQYTGKITLTSCMAILLTAALLLSGCGVQMEKKQSTSASLKDDYYAAVNAEVLNSHKAAGENGSWNWFWDLTDKAKKEQEDIVKTAAENVSKNGEAIKAADSSSYRIGELYLMASDQTARDKSGVVDLNTLMKPVMDAKNVQDMMDALAVLQYQYGFNSLLNTDVYIPDDDPGTNAVRITALNYILLADDFVSSDEEDGSKSLFTGDLLKLMKAAGQNVSSKDMEDIYQFLKTAAAASNAGKKAIVQNTDSTKTETSSSAQNAAVKKPSDLSIEKAMSISDLTKHYSNINLSEVLGRIFKTPPLTVRIEDDGNLDTVNSYLTDQNLQMLKNYAYLVNLTKFAPYLSTEISDAYQVIQKNHFGDEDSEDSENTKESGSKKAASLEKQVYSLLNWDTAKIYCSQNFDEAKKAGVEKLVNEILAQYKTMLQKEDWLTESTRSKAIEKLEKLKLRIGAPDDLVRYLSSWTPDKSKSYFGNVLAIASEASIKKYDSAGKKADRTVWQVLPQDCNPCYYPTDNSINIPVAVMFEPYFSVEQTEEQNLGALGTIIGHEITHAFDDLGHLYDANGDYRNWWTKADETAFGQRAQAIVAYYSAYKTPGAMQQDGTYTLGENIADLGAMHCLTEIVKSQHLSADRFFRAYANSWASVTNSMTDALVSGMDEHASDKVRVNAVLASNSLFYETYQITSANGMYLAPKTRVALW
ncbi:MAG TPA: M13 family metallopeptidase [Lachnospiraceae bacterium]|nr:M13 family metallopeptidase [Lachnospiraceae bacterium]